MPIQSPELCADWVWLYQFFLVDEAFLHWHLGFGQAEASQSDEETSATARLTVIAGAVLYGVGDRPSVNHQYQTQL